MFVCNLCEFFISESFGQVLRHIGEIHRSDPGLHIHCGLDGCTKSYNNYESFRSHVYRKHRGHLVEPTPPLEVVDRPCVRDPNPCAALVGRGQEEQHEGDPGDFVLPQVQIENVDHDVKRAAMKLLLKTKEENRLTQTAVNGLVGDLRQTWREWTTMVRENLHQRCETEPLSAETVDACLEDLAPFDGLESEHLQKKFCRENFHLLEPDERVLGRYMVVENAVEREVKDLCYDIPLIESLQCLLRTTTVIDQVLNPHCRDDGVLGDYCDGENFKKSPLFSTDETALQILLYYDEIEVCNPIGSKATVHKLGVFYYTLGNLDPKFRSSLKAIQLLCVVKYNHIKKYGITEVLAPIVRAIWQLEDGVEFHTKYGIQKLRGSIAAVSADNLAAWLLGGYKALGSAFRRCQYCMAVFDDVQTKFTEGELQLRTRELYSEHCDQLHGPLRDHFSTVYGVVESSLLNNTQFFHVTDGLVPDVMHDILEGTLPLTLKELLKYCIQEKQYFTLAQLNSAICAFKYGPDKANKPCPITNIDHLKQNGSQMWCLGRLLPLFVGHFVPEGDRNWDNFTLLLDITDYSFAPTLMREKADHIATMVQLFLVEFTQLYPERNLTPKMHYMVHLATWTKRCGPLKHMWCMRFEAKHSYFKHLARVVGNFKNIAKTLAHRHQHYMCYQLMNDTYLQHDTKFTGGKPLCLAETEHSPQLRQMVPDLNNQAIIQRVKSAEINGIKYTIQSVILFGWNQGQPTFGEIVAVFVLPNSSVLFITELFQAVSFDGHYHAYEVVSTGSKVACRHEDFKVELVFLKCHANDAVFVLSKFHIFN